MVVLLCVITFRVDLRADCGCFILAFNAGITYHHVMLRVGHSRFLFFGLGAFLGILTSTSGQSVSDYAVRVSAQVQVSPPQIVLSWPGDAAATGYAVYRKPHNEIDWVQVASLGSVTGYTDSDILLGGAYEYIIRKTSGSYFGFGEIYSGFQVPLVEARGKVVLIVDETFSTSLAAELTRFQSDLSGDGWTVIRHDVDRMAVSPSETSDTVWAARLAEITAVKALIRGDYETDSGNVKSVILLGRVAVPYSGNLAPDDHPDHVGAWPADLYYGSMSGSWSDSTVSSTIADSSRHWNVPGDGKFDQTSIPADVTLSVGRIDFSNMPAFSQSETELLRRYLKKVHRFRHALVMADRRGLIDDEFGVVGGQPLAVSGWRNFSGFFGAASTFTGDWMSTLGSQSYLWGYGCGAGTWYNNCRNVTSTAGLAVADPKVVFTMLFGSYFGDWDSQNNLLRAAIATPTYTLTSAWAGRPHWHFQHMALGETIGFSTRLSQNNAFTYDPGVDARERHIALMGDPTLRMHVVGPPAAVVAMPNSSGGVDLVWGASTDSVLGYHIYRASAAGGPFARLNSSLLSGTSYSDSTPAGERHYMVRAVKLETSASGTYYNASQGIFAQSNPGTTLVDDTEWAGGDHRTWKVNNATGTAGSDPGWDLLNVLGTLNITATEASKFTIELASLEADNTPGSPANFDMDTSYTWRIATASEPITGFNAAKFEIVTTQFLGDLGGGRFSVALSTDSKSIDLVFTRNRAPTAAEATFTRTAGTALRIPISDLLSGFTSDPDGDARSLVNLGSGASGSTITSDDNYIYFTRVSNDSDTFGYEVKDARDYRPGDTMRTASSTITISTTAAVSSVREISASGGTVKIRFAGIPGFSYTVERASVVTGPWSVKQTTTAPANGVWEFSDSSPLETTGFYRLTHP